MTKKVISISLLIVSIGILTLASTACSSAAEAQIDDNVVGYRQGGPADVEAQPQGDVGAGAPETTDGSLGQAGPGFDNETRGANSRGAPDAIQQGMTAASFGNGRGRGSSGSGNGGRGNGGIGGGMLAAGELSDVEMDALLRAIDEEYGARALYEGVMATFGDVEPFTWIANSEVQHAWALTRMAQRYGLEVPEYPGAAVLTNLDTLEAACQAGVQAEIADAALYDELMLLTEKTDLLRVFENLQSASLQSHLPAFQACE